MMILADGKEGLGEGKEEERFTIQVARSFPPKVIAVLILVP